MAWRPASADPSTGNSLTYVDYQGHFSFDSDDPGPFFLSFYTTDNGDCSHSALTNFDHYRPSWYVSQPFSGNDPNTALPPAGATQVIAGSSDTVACLARGNVLPSECATPNATLSGRVVSFGPEPVAEACVVILGQNTQFGPAVTDADGRWSISGLPVNYPFVVGVVPPMDTGRGPCQFDGPPPAPPAGALQPEFYTNTWVDLADPELLSNTYQWAILHGADPVSNTASGLDVCLTTEVGSDTPRGSCDPPTPTPTPTVTPTTAPTSTTTAPQSVSASGAAAAGLAETGGPSILLPILGLALVIAAGGVFGRVRMARSRRGRRA